MKNLGFLIARIDRIGDVVLSTALPREIKKKYPESFVAVLVRNYTRDIYLNNPYVDLIITYDDETGNLKPFWFMRKELSEQNFSYAFMLLPNERLNYLLFATGIKNRIGVGHKLYQFITFTKYVNRKKYNPLRHEADYCLDMIRKIGIDANDYTPEIFLTDKEKVIAKNFREEIIIKQQMLIGINVTSGNSAPNLPVSEYKRLIDILKENPNYKVAVIDNRIPESVDNIKSVIYPNRNNNLRKSIINLSVFDLIISSSTGPMHLAATLKVPTLSLFCPLTACSPKLWGPLGNKSEIIMPSDTYCATQCPIDPKKCDYSKEGGLRAEEVMKKLEFFIDSLKK